MKSKVQKSSELKVIKDLIPSSKAIVFTTFSRAGEKGLSVAQMTEMKRMLRSMNARYFVIKKSLTDIALKGLNLEGADVFSFNGSLGLALGGEDAYALAKSLYDFSKKNPALQFHGAFIDGVFVGQEGFMEMAQMPSREVLLGRLLGMMKYPISGLYITLSEIAKQKESAAVPAN